MKPPLSLIYYGEPRPPERDALVSLAGKRSGRAVEWLSAAQGGGSPGAVRNAAVAACAGEYVLFVDDRESFETTFVEQACRQLDGRGKVAFVTGWLDGVPERADPPPRALTAAMLLGRPWFAHVPTVFRKSAWHDARGFDERAFRQLVAEGELLDERRRKLEGENHQLNQEAARLQGLLARHGGP